jgi:hypothetical protein
MKKIIQSLLVAPLCLLTFIANSQSDTPCGAPALTVAAGCSNTAGTTVGASYQNNGANGGTPTCASPGAPDVWYSFVAPASGNILIQTTDGNITDSGMALYSGACGSLTQVSCDDDSGTGNMSQISATGLTAGATYYVRLWKYSAGTGTFSICITAVAGPANNTTCTVQTPICSGSPIVFTANTGGTPASTVNPGNNYQCLSTSPNPSWYYLEIATGGNLVVDITAGSDVDFAIWGPFASQAAGNAACNSYGVPLDCSYSIAAVEQVNVAGVVSGQVYVLLVTNYANTVQNITVTNAGGTATTNCGIVTLPVGFSNWDAYLSGDKVRMSWTTESEHNNDYFVVERSSDGLIWEALGFVDGNGSTNNASHYGYTDDNPKEGVNYYRLKQVDLNGASNATNIIPVEYRVSVQLHIYPNPTKGNVFVQQDDYTITSVELIDVTGRSRSMAISPGTAGVSVDCKELAKGTYTLRSIDEMGNVFSSILIIE